MKITENPNAIEAVNALYGSSSYHTADANGKVKWKDDHETTEEEKTAIDAKVIELQAEFDAQEYARNRALAYPSTGDQLDMMYKDTKNSTTTHADAVEAVKTKWPKDNSGPI